MTNLPGTVLRLSGAAPIPCLDPAGATEATEAQILRLVSRQLFTYPAEPDLRQWRVREPVPDLAVAVPSTYNAGLGASYLAHVVHLRPGVLWDTVPPRPVTSHDVVRGLKRLAAPTARSPLLCSLASTVRGLAGFASEYARVVDPQASAEEFAAFQNAHDVSGLVVLDDETLVVELIRPTLDLADLLAQPAAAAAPIEYDRFRPGRPPSTTDLHSTGPYRLAPPLGDEIVRLEPNPVWGPGTDPERRQDHAAIEVHQVAASPAQVASLVSSGAADLPWGAPRARSSGRPCPAHHLGQELSPYLVLNLRSPRSGVALGRAEVRRALALAFDRQAMADLLTELVPGDLVTPATGLVPPGNGGHVDENQHRGDPTAARAALAAVGVPSGLSLVAIHPDDEVATRIAERYAADLAAAGVDVSLVALPADIWRRALREPEGWDVAALSWYPGFTYLNGRALLQPLATQQPGNANHGSYQDPEAERLIDQALETIEPVKAAAVWAHLASRLLLELPVVPLAFRTTAGPPLTGPRVLAATALPHLGHTVDLCTVSLRDSRVR